MNLQEVKKGGQLVLLDFYADWCGPCQSMLPIIESIQEDLKDKVQIIKIDVDKSPRIAATQRIRSIPAFILYKDKQLLWKHTGIITKKELKEKILKYDF